MRLESVNRAIGYSFMILGAAKILIGFIAILYMISVLGTIFTPNVAYALDGSSGIVLLGNIRKFAELILLIAAIILLIINIIKVNYQTVFGCLIVLCSAIIESFLPTLIIVFTFYVFGLAYIKGGKMMMQMDDTKPMRRVTKKEIQDTDWFYNDKKEDSTDNIADDNKKDSN